MRKLLRICWFISPAIPEIRYEPYVYQYAGQRVIGELGHFQVPERYDHPFGPKITLAFLRLKSTSHTLGTPMVYLAGGPGGSAIHLAKGARGAVFLRACNKTSGTRRCSYSPHLDSAIPACARADRSTLSRLGGTYPARRNMRRADEESCGRSNQPSPGSVASAKCLGAYKVADVFRVGGLGFIWRASGGCRDMLVGHY
jgi:hypothetical protein